ncbi:MAG: hypothetical protein ABSC73_00180 [Acidimicrobiales bacterium]
MLRPAGFLRRGRVLAPAARGLVAVGLVVGLSAAFTGVAAGSVRPLHHPRGLGGRPAAAGTVAAPPADNAFPMMTRLGATLTVDVTASTTYVERGVSSPTLADVTQGELVAVFGTLSGTTVTASEVVNWMPRGGGFQPAAAGVVAAPPADNAFPITTRSGVTLTVDVTASTTYAERGVSSPTLADVTQGELVAVFGTISGTTVTASEVGIVPRRPNHGFATAGVVQATPTSAGFTVLTWNGTTMIVDVTTSTTYFERGVSTASLADVTQGGFVGVFGTISGTTVTAVEVVIVPPRPNHGFATAGVVQATPTSAGFTVLTWNGTTMTVDVTASTTYAEYGVSAPSIANVLQGEFVGVFGTTSGTTVSASEVVIVGSRAHGLFGSGPPFRCGRDFGGFGFGRGSGGFGPASGDHGHGGHRHHG